MQHHIKRKSFLIPFLTFLLCFEIFGYSIAGYSFTLNFTDTHLNSNSCIIDAEQRESDSPFAPGLPVENKEEGSKENEEKSPDKDLFAASNQLSNNFLSDRYSTNLYFSADNFSSKNLPLYILFHSWKSFTS